MTSIPHSSPAGSPVGVPPRVAAEKTRFTLCLILSIVMYGLLFVLAMKVFRSFTGVLILAASIWLAGLVARAFLIARIRGNGVMVSPTQFPHVLDSAQKACSQFGVAMPEIYLVQYGKLRQTLAEFFLSSKLLVLSSQLADECGQGPKLDFVLGREIGHIALQHHWWNFALAPSAIFPLAYAAWRRTTEYSADLCGLAVCGDLQSAQHAMLISAVGHLSGEVELSAYRADLQGSGGFWTTLRQLRAYHPDVNWRLSRLIETAHPATRGPRRSIAATVLCALMPSVNPQTRSLGGSVGFMVVIASIALMVSFLLPSLAKARQMARQSQALAQMHSYNCALQIYASEYNGYLPPNLATLEREGYTPSRQRQSGVVHYVPFASCSINQVSDPDRVVVFFSEEGRRGVAGFLDGRCEAMSDFQLQQAVEYSREILNRASYMQMNQAPLAEPAPALIGVDGSDRNSSDAPRNTYYGR